MYNKVLCGLDIGTNSVGWCLTDEKNKIIRKQGKALWGVRMFDEASGCAERRQHRSDRRRLKRRKERIELLRLLMAEEINKTDPTFFMRLDQSFFQKEDRTEPFEYTLFNDKNYTDSDYYKEYPTIYHLRKHLLESHSKEDIRLIYLALHHMIKYRGNFLNGEERFQPMNSKEADEYFDELEKSLSSVLDGETIHYTSDTFRQLQSVFQKTHGITALKEEFGKILNPNNNRYIKEVIIPLLSGGNVSIKKLHFDRGEDLEFKNICVKDEAFDSNIETLLSVNEEKEEWINGFLCCKKIYQFFLLGKLLGDRKYLSDAMVERYNQHHRQLRDFKKYIKKNHKEKYSKIFRKQKEDIDNYAKYIGSNLTKNHKNRNAHCKAEDFYKFLKDELELKGSKIDERSLDDYEKQILSLMEDNEFLPRLNSTDNGVFPYQLNLMEMEEMLNRQSEYYPFFSREVEDGTTVKDCIVSILKYKIPYFVGPLISPKEGNERSKFSWIKRTEEKIYPWNFQKVVDLDETAKNFINKMLNKCTYLPSNYCLPKNSLLFSYFNVLQVLNKTFVNGDYIPKDLKRDLIEELFKKKRKVTKKSLIDFIHSKKGETATITTSTGKDLEELNCSLASFNDFKKIFGTEEYVLSHFEQIEDIIRDIVIFEDKSILEKRLKENYSIRDRNIIKQIKGLNYSKFANISKELLTDLTYYDESAERNFSIIELMELTNQNLQEILFDEAYGFQKKIAEYNQKNSAIGDIETIEEYVKEMGMVSPGMKRPLIQAYKICEELEKIIGQPIDEYYVECTRTNRAEKKRTSSRYQKMETLYNEAIQTAREDQELKSVYQKLKNADPNKFQSDKYYLYFSQMGKCLYSGEAIEIEDLWDTSKYDIDHIIPQSMVKDDSLDNRVLVKQSLNRTDKSDQYPIPQSMLFNGNYKEAYQFYKTLKDRKLISEEKYHRLTRHEELSEKELSAFVNRQLVSTNQAVKGFISAIKYFKTTDDFKPKIVYSKSENISDFRKQFDIVKCRSANNFHHAHDAYLNIVVGRVIDNYFAPYGQNKYTLQRMHANGLTTNPNKIFIQNKLNTKQNIMDGEGNLIWDYDLSVQKVKRTIENRFDILTTTRAYYGNELLSKVTIYPKGKGNIPTKKNRITERYGGYKEVSFGSYALIKVKNKYILEAIPTMLKERREEYLNREYGEYELILDNLKKNTIIESGEKKFAITGKTGDQYVLLNQKERIFSSKQMKILKKIDRLFEKLSRKIRVTGKETIDKLKECGIDADELGILIAPAANRNTKEIRLTSEEIDEMFEAFINILNKSIYGFSICKKIASELGSNREKFHSLPIFERVYLIFNLNGLLKCNERKTADLEAIDLSKNSGVLKFSKTLSNCKIIFESTTGFYRKVAFEIK